MHDKLAIRVNTSDTSEFVLKTQQNTDKSSLKWKLIIPARKYLMLVNLLKKDCNTKTTEIEGEIPSIIGLATTAILNDVKNKIPEWRQ